MGLGRIGEIADGYKISSCGYKNILKLDGGNSCVPYEYNTKTIELYTLSGWITWYESKKLRD